MVSVAAANFCRNPKHEYENKVREWNSRPGASRNRASKINAVHFTRLRSHRGDAELYMWRFREHLQFMKRYFELWQGRGDTNPFRERSKVVNLQRNMVPPREKALDLMRENKLLLWKIEGTKGKMEVTSHQPLSKKCQRKLDYKRFVPPTEILKKYEGIPLPRGEHLWRVLRPRVWFELELRVPYSQKGRLVIELYTEAAPMVVREFVKVCHCQQIDRVRMLRLFPNLWLEGEIKLDDTRLTTHALEYDMRALRHDAGSGILSFPMEFVKGFYYGVLSFTISSRPIKVLNGKRVAFGRVIHGMKMVTILQEYGTKNGKLKKPLDVTACGIET